MTNRELPWTCVRCGYVMDASTDINDKDAVPKNGDLSVCLKCAHVYQRREDKWQPMSAAELGTLDRETRAAIIRVQIAVRIIATKRKGNPNA